MKKYHDEDIMYAKNLRQVKGYSFAELQRITGVPATTIRNWCKNETTANRWNTLLLTNERKRQLIKRSEHPVIDQATDIKSSQAKIYTALLYWCEGYKYPASNKMGFTNSDPELIKLFINLLRKAFTLNESKFKVHLQLHTTHNLDKAELYWSKLLQIPRSQFMKPTITEKKGGKHRTEYHGTCTLRYSDFKLQLKLIGIYEAFIKRFGGVA